MDLLDLLVPFAKISFLICSRSKVWLKTGEILEPDYSLWHNVQLVAEWNLIDKTGCEIHRCLWDDDDGDGGQVLSWAELSWEGGGGTEVVGDFLNFSRLEHHHPVLQYSVARVIIESNKP